MQGWDMWLPRPALRGHLQTWPSALGPRPLDQPPSHCVQE